MLLVGRQVARQVYALVGRWVGRQLYAFGSQVMAKQVYALVGRQLDRQLVYVNHSTLPFPSYFTYLPTLLIYTGTLLQIPYSPVTFVRDNIALPLVFKPASFLEHTKFYPPTPPPPTTAKAGGGKNMMSSWWGGRQYCSQKICTTLWVGRQHHSCTTPLFIDDKYSRKGGRYLQIR